MRLIEAESNTQWILKYPTACGAAGHCMLNAASVAPNDWLTPYVGQEFIRWQRPVGTDGVFNHVDRDIGVPGIAKR